MPVILVFGDSNAWGADPAGGQRLARRERWPGVMAAALGADFEVIEEGLRGRTTVFDDPDEPGRRGLDYFPPCLLTHAPIDLVVIALGVNDAKAKFAASPEEIAAGMETLVEAALGAPVGPGDEPPRALVVAPPPIARLTGLAEMFDGAAAKVARLPDLYRRLAERKRVGFVDAGQFIRASDLDGVHYDKDRHALLGAVMAEAARMILA